MLPITPRYKRGNNCNLAEIYRCANEMSIKGVAKKTLMDASRIIRRAVDSFHLRAGRLAGPWRQEPLEPVKNHGVKGLAARYYLGSDH
jgi:hypothetical protein